MMRQTQLKWPSGKINQIALIISILGILGSIYTLIRHLFFIDSIEIASSLNFFTGFNFVLGILGLTLVAWLTRANGHLFLSSAAIFLICRFLVEFFVILIFYEEFLLAEILIIVLGGIGYILASLGFLRQEKLFDW